MLFDEAISEERSLKLVSSRVCAVRECEDADKHQHVPLEKILCWQSEKDDKKTVQVKWLSVYEFGNGKSVAEVERYTVGSMGFKLWRTEETLGLFLLLFHQHGFPLGQWAVRADPCR